MYECEGASRRMNDPTTALQLVLAGVWRPGWCVADTVPPVSAGGGGEEGEDAA